MIRITREADYGILLMTALAQAEYQPRSAAALARQRRLPLPMVSKILKALTRSGLLNSQRGAQGGYILARSATEISTADIIGALEGPIAITACSDESHDSCTRQDDCEISGHWPRINLAIHTALQSISLEEMSQPHSPRPVRFHSISRAATTRAIDHPV
ncbi:MAG: SUF system Fe-S cluster assembly regulator [Gammaproteobacteria bacterium]|nr:SUF system Fe-S cluster assembly regulator [Gammaproteobacteria bacterium]MCP5196408.1 SUF system Fe-S cluster assembly regulator [Gammaproteobacteria bacterium]